MSLIHNNSARKAMPILLLILVVAFISGCNSKVAATAPNTTSPDNNISKTS